MTWKGTTWKSLRIRYRNRKEKCFTQEEVNKIVQSRLARAKFDSTPDFSAREAELLRRETQLDARERLAEAGLPKELVSALNCSDKETMEKSIETLMSFMNSTQTGVARPKNSYRVVSTGTAGNTNTGSNEEAERANIRKAMGLKG